MNKLKIDTTDRSKTEASLNNSLEVEKNLPKSQTALPLIEKILKKHNRSIKDVSEIEVNVGPGSFTGTRVGVAIANALGYALKIKVNGKKAGEVKPKYS